MTELIYNIHNIFDASSREGCLHQHGCMAYRIPPYQRGYKWGSEESQPVDMLLRDLKQAWKSKAKEYLLQAITVKKVSDSQRGSVLEVIDGQQRLTTLHILIHALSHRLTGSVSPNIAENRLRYSIRHENQNLDMLVAEWIKKDGAAASNFQELKAAHNVEGQERQDCYYLQCATLRCLHALTDGLQSGEELQDFHKFVLHEVKLMVNAVEPHISGEEIFGNLNSNRVALTETELIKGLLLTRVARESVAGRTRRYREVLELRIQLGRKWDELTHWANQPEIQRLYFPEFENDAMRGLLELVAQRMPEPYASPAKPEVKPLFEYFFKQRHFVHVFRLLADTSAQLQDWHEHDPTYHLLGFCLVHHTKPGARMSFLLERLKHKTKADLSKELRVRRRTILAGDKPADLDFNKLRYGEGDSQIQSILLALSVFQTAARTRFNFFAYEAEAWSIEHIFPQSPFGKGAILTDAQKGTLHQMLHQIIANNAEVLPQETAKQLARFGDPTTEDEKNEIERLLQSEPLLHRTGNLCLLTLKDNAAIGCSMFDIKRKAIRDRIAKGSFVPAHTYEVFSKMIVGEDESIDVWSKKNIENHQAEIEKRIRALIEDIS